MSEIDRSNMGLECLDRWFVMHSKLTREIESMGSVAFLPKNYCDLLRHRFNWLVFVLLNVWTLGFLEGYQPTLPPRQSRL